jgi:hypothetical protein
LRRAGPYSTVAAADRPQLFASPETLDLLI